MKRTYVVHRPPYLSRHRYTPVIPRRSYTTRLSADGKKSVVRSCLQWALPVLVAAFLVGFVFFALGVTAGRIITG